MPRSPQSRRRSGVAHQRRRAALIRTTRPGSPCPRCLQPLLAEQGVWGRGLDADHLSVEAVLQPNGLPDALSHRRCNQLHGAMLGAALRGVHDPEEKKRIVIEVTERCHAKLRGQRAPHPQARRFTQRAEPSPQPKRVSSW